MPLVFLFTPWKHFSSPSFKPFRVCGIFLCSLRVFLCFQGIYKRPVVWNGLKNSVCTSISERTKWTVKYRFTRCLNMLSDPISLGGNVWFPDVLTSNNSLWLTLNYWGCSFNSGRRLALGERNYRRKRRSGSFSGRFLTYYV